MLLFITAIVGFSPSIPTIAFKTKSTFLEEIKLIALSDPKIILVSELVPSSSDKFSYDS